ncbi:hypothetical protein [Kibdelosporangium phytohabitans]|uniref:Uncharacterized protein n=1 Tax=Kibdelosporangium phytohabitans TaxID=860235 RepID=A0A0N9HWK0_9PSEU|nr:hypothetical protein [Kibdelosporangium phytohabitans]ALG06393.1 hypothetical protein AOZ06_05145 [Kibdelosporangium phytohabitans]MBE1467541.1 hypothetical protein [Kibdelosporangium phytohabitans]
MAAVVLLRQPDTASPSARPAPQHPIPVVPSTPTAPSPFRTTIESSDESGSFLGLGWRTSGVTVTAGASGASAFAFGIGTKPNPSSGNDQPCANVVTSEHHGGSSGDPIVTISVAQDATVTIHVRGPGDGPPHSIIVPLAACPLNRVPDTGSPGTPTEPSAPLDTRTRRDDDVQPTGK